MQVALKSIVTLGTKLCKTVNPTSFKGLKCAKAVSNVVTTEERICGSLFGGAIGDAFGAPIEFATLEKIKSKFGACGLKFIPKKGGKYRVTDDTQMTLFTADGLLKSFHANPRLDIEPDYRILYSSYLDWYKTQAIQFDSDIFKAGLLRDAGLFEKRLPGVTCIDSLKHGIAGSVEKPLNNSAGNGGVMRVAPVGIFYNKSPELAFTVGIKSAALTHGNPDGYLPAGYNAALIAELVNGRPINSAINTATSILKKYPNAKSTLSCVDRAQELANSSLAPEAAIRQIGKGAKGDEALGIALYSVLKHPNSFKDAITTAINHSGDSDTTGAIAGNIIGGLLGIKRIPRNLVENIEYEDWLTKFSKFLNKKASQVYESLQATDKQMYERRSADVFKIV